MARTFPLVTYRNSGLQYEADDSLRAKITTATNLQLSLDSVAVFDGVAEWQVVEYTYASIQTGDIAFATTDATRTASVSTVDTIRTWLLFSYSSPDGTTANMGQKMVRGVVTNATALTFDRDQTGQTLALTWYLVTFTDDTRVQGGTASFSTSTTQVDATIGSVDTTKAIAVAGAYHHAGGKTPYNPDDNPGTGTTTLDLTTATNLRITRGLTGGQTANIGWFVVEFGTVITGSRIAGTFPTDILSEDGVFVQYREAVRYADAAIAYRSNTGPNTVSSPKTRLWDASSWGSEGEESTAGSPIRAVRMAWSPTVPSTRIFVTESDDGWLDAYVCSATCTVTNNIGRVWSTAPGTPERRFDVAYENVSGDALLAYGVLSTDPAQDIAFRVFSLGSWGPEQYLDDTGHATDVQYTQIDLAPKKGSDIIGMIGGDDTNDDANAWIWDGDAWGSYTEITPTMESPNYRQVALAWESSSGNLLAVAALATSNDIISKEYSTSWSGTSQFTCASGSGMTKHTFWLSLKANPLATANDMVLGLVQENYDLNTCYWTGSAWADWVQHDNDYDAVQTRAFDFAWENSGSKGLLVWGTSRTTGGGQITYKTFTAPNTWGPQTNAAMGSGFDQWVQLRTNPFPGTVKILGAVLDSNQLLGAIKWDGSTFTVIGSSTFSANTGIASHESFDLQYRPTIDGGLAVRYDFADVPTGTVHTVKVKGYRQDEDVNVQVLTPPATWTTRITISATSNTLYTYDLTTSEYNAGAPSIRFRDAGGPDGTASDLWVDVANVTTTNTWDRILLMRSLDTSGSSWGSQIILASGRSTDNPIRYSYASAEPSIAMDSGGFLHVVWVSAASAGNQKTMNLVRYTKSTVAWPTQNELATGTNWEVVTPVDDTNPGYMPTVSTDTSNNPHIAWSQLKSITASEAAAIEYRSNTGTNTVNSPKSRTWDGTSWSAPEIEEATTGSPLRNVRMAYSPIAIDERIVVTVSDDGWLDAYVCTPTCTVTNNLGQVWSSAPSVADYRFDIAYEELSGRALLVYGVLSTDTTHDIAYREYTGSWGPEQYLDNTNNATDLQYIQIELAPKAGSDQVGLMAGTTNYVVTAWIWSGTAFGSFAEVTPTGFASSLGDRMAIAWETNSGHLLAVTAAAPLGETIVYREFTTSWSSSSTYPCGTSGKSDYWLSLKPNPVPTTDEMILLIGQTSSPVSTCYWSGSGWSNFLTHDATSDSWTTRVEDFAWESTGSRGLLVWGTTTGQITYRTFTAPNTWGTITNVAMGTTVHDWVTLRTNPFPQPGRPRILGAVLDVSDNLGAITWDGSAFTVVGANSFTADTGSHTFENFDLQYHPAPGSVYYKNRAGGTWRPTVVWGTTYTGLSVDVSPQNNYVALAGYFDNTAEQAAIAYRSNTGSNTINSPKARTWDGSTWSAEVEQANANNPIRVVRMAWSPTDANTRIIVTESDDGFLDAYVCTPTCVVTNNIGQVWSTAPASGTPQARFDVAYEQVSGKAVLAYHKEGGSGTQDLAYKTYSGGSWSAEQYIDDPGSASTHYVYSVVKLASKRGSNQIGLIGGDLTNTHVNAWIWDGAAWGNFVAIATTSVGPVDRDNADLAWESGSGNLLAVVASNSANIVSREYSSSWGSAVTFSCASAPTIPYTRLKANPLATAHDMVLAG